MSKNFKTFNAIHVVGSTGVDMKVGIPLAHLDPALSGFSYHVGYKWGVVVSRCLSFRVFCYDLTSVSERAAFVRLYNCRAPSSLVTGGGSPFLLLV